MPEADSDAPIPRFRIRRSSTPQACADQIATLADVARLPFSVRPTARPYPFGMFARPRAKLARLHASSGTTGKPTVVGYTLKDLETWAGLMARSMACAGVRPGDVANAYGYGCHWVPLRRRAARLVHRAGPRRRH
jgi:phenylacetate-CoA ligase